MTKVYASLSEYDVDKPNWTCLVNGFANNLCKPDQSNLTDRKNILRRERIFNRIFHIGKVLAQDVGSPKNVRI